MALRFLSTAMVTGKILRFVREHCPSGLVPSEIVNYVQQNQKNVTIVSIEKNSKGYDVELSNGVDIKFNSAGRFIRYDD
ncbi:MAG: PepSY-like domain-containing protein [Prevotella sp.]|nr:PepSY-like domain-containing protein [Prevotella sp.]